MKKTYLFVIFSLFCGWSWGKSLLLPPLSNYEKNHAYFGKSEKLLDACIYSKQQWVGLAGRPRDYNLQLNYRPLDRLSIGTLLQSEQKGFENNVSANLYIGTSVFFKKDYVLSVFLSGNYTRFMLDFKNVITEIPSQDYLQIKGWNAWHVGSALLFQWKQLNLGSSFSVGNLNPDMLRLQYLWDIYSKFHWRVNENTELLPWVSYTINVNQNTFHEFNLGFAYIGFNRFEISAELHIRKNLQKFSLGGKIRCYHHLWVSYQYAVNFSFQSAMYLNHGGIHEIGLHFSLDKKKKKINDNH